MPDPSMWLTWGISAVAVAGVIMRPFGWLEFIWAAGGAACLVMFGLLPAADALAGAGRGTDVYLFLTGMMLLSELAREQGLFDWLAARTANLAGGNAARLFSLIFAVSVLVTIFLSNDATAVVLTPAVAAMARAAEASEALPFVLICAFVANAASFVLPISNPANLVIYGSHMPTLLHWLPAYALPSVAAIGATYGVLRLTQRRTLTQSIRAGIDVQALSTGGKVAAFGIGSTAIVLLAASAFGFQLGLPTFLASAATALLVVAGSRCRIGDVLKGMSWGVLPLVAGLFILVEALQKTGVIEALAHQLQALAQHSATQAAWLSGVLLAIGGNLVNNLPAGLVAGRAAEAVHVPDHVRAAILIGVDLGPNLSVTGSLATILWLTALRREGVAVDAWTFLKLGILVMPPALFLGLAAIFLDH